VKKIASSHRGQLVVEFKIGRSVLTQELGKPPAPKQVQHYFPAE